MTWAHRWARASRRPLCDTSSSRAGPGGGGSLYGDSLCESGGENEAGEPLVVSACRTEWITGWQGSLNMSASGPHTGSLCQHHYHRRYTTSQRRQP